MYAIRSYYERRAELVVHVAEELAFEAIQLLELLVRLAQAPVVLDRVVVQPRALDGNAEKVQRRDEDLASYNFV